MSQSYTAQEEGATLALQGRKSEFGSISRTLPHPNRTSAIIRSGKANRTSAIIHLGRTPHLPIVYNDFVSGCVSQGKGGVMRESVLA